MKVKRGNRIIAAAVICMAGVAAESNAGCAWEQSGGRIIMATDTGAAIEQPRQQEARWRVGMEAGTMGLGVSAGYQLSEQVRIRLRGAALRHDSTEEWGSMNSRLKLQGNNAGILLDYFPWGRHFYLCAGVTISESRAVYHARFRQKEGFQNMVDFGGQLCKITQGDEAGIRGSYSWNHLQPYIGIGYQDELWENSGLYYSIDIGINIMGKGELEAQSYGGLKYRDPESYQWKAVTEGEARQMLRREGKDFFDLADSLSIYPVLQLGVAVEF